MISAFFQYWYLLLIFFVCGVVLGSLNRKRINNVLESFFSKASLIKKYWFFVVPFTILSIIAYILTFALSSQQNLGNNISTLNQATTLTFAIFAGYFAFQQVVEHRLDKLKEQGRLYFKQSSYKRALQSYEQALSIDSKDYSTIAELLEIYLAIQDFQKFDEKLPLMKDVILEDYERITLYYLKITKFLLKQDIGSGKGELEGLLSFIEEKPSALVHFSWDFSDIQKTDVFKKLDGESKNILQNLIKYLLKQLNDDEKKQFEEGNFSLKNKEKSEKK